MLHRNQVPTGATGAASFEPGFPAPGATRVAALFGVLAAASLMPLLLSWLPPILDYPNHLARMHVLADLPGSTTLGRYYRAAWTPIPDLALDSILPWLARLTSAESAMRVGVAAILLGLAGGTAVLHRVGFGRWSHWPLLAFLLLYNRMLLWGFLNYLAGLALALWCVAAWLLLESRRPAIRLGAGAVTATLIYLAHLAAFGCYAVVTIGMALAPGPSGSWRATAVLSRVWVPLAATFPAGALFLLSPTAGASREIAYGNPFRKLDLPVSIFDNYDRLFDGATFAVVLIAAIIALYRRKVVLHPTLGWGLAGLLIAYLLLPSRLFSAAGIDHRLPIAIAFFLVAASDWRGSSRGRTLVLGAAGLLFAVRLAIVAIVWDGAGKEYAALRPAFDQIGIGDTVAVAAPSRAVQAGGVPLLHFPTLAVVTSDAFVPTLFADPAQQPVRFTAEATRLAERDQPARIWSALADGGMPSLPGFDLLMIVDPPKAMAVAPDWGTILYSAPRLMLIRLSGTSSQ